MEFRNLIPVKLEVEKIYVVEFFITKFDFNFANYLLAYKIIKELFNF